MSYFDAYKKRLKVDNLGDSFKLDTIDNTIREFKNNPSYKSAILIDYNLDEIPIDIRIVNEDKSPNYKRFHFEFTSFFLSCACIISYFFVFVGLFDTRNILTLFSGFKITDGLTFLACF